MSGQEGKPGKQPSFVSRALASLEKKMSLCQHLSSTVRTQAEMPMGGFVTKMGSEWLYSIRTKLLATMLLFVVIAAVVSLGGLERFLEGIFRHRTEEEVSALAEGIKASLRQQMLKENDGFTQETLMDVGQTGHVHRILILDLDGEAAYAFPAAERKHTFNFGPIPVATRASLATAASGQPVYRLLMPLVNEPRCQECHDAADRFNGALLIERSAAGEAETLGTVHQRLVGTWALTTGVLGLIILGITTVYIHRPVRRLIEGARRIGTGDLSARVALRGRGELPELGASFNQMAANLTALLDEVRHKKFEMSVLYGIAERVSKSINIGELKLIILEMVGEIFAAPRVWLVTPTNEPGELEVLEHPGTSGKPDRHLVRDAEKSSKLLPFNGKVLEQWSAQKMTGPRVEDDSGRLLLPIYFRDRALALIVTEVPPAPATVLHDNLLLAAMGSHIAVAMENARLYTLAITDDLTQLYSFRHFQINLEDQVNRYQRYGQPLALLMLDLDHFKAVNDTYGHPAGDMVLKQMAGRLHACMRMVDVACRYGGEEFAVILPHCDPGAAGVVAERIRARVADTPFDLGTGVQIPVTVSIGVAVCPRDTTTPRDLVSLADQALYWAKRRGYNRICQAEEIMPPSV